MKDNKACDRVRDLLSPFMDGEVSREEKELLRRLAALKGEPREGPVRSGLDSLKDVIH